MGDETVSDTSRFDQAASTWDEDPRRVELARAVGTAIVGQLRLTREMDVLDFGCGTGLLTLALQPLVHSVTGADTSSAMLGVLEQKIEARGLANVSAVLLDPAEPLASGSRFHLIVSSMALHHVADLAPLFERFHDLLRSEGRIALADLDREDGSFHGEAGDVFHLGFDRSEIQSLLRGAGFADLAATTAIVTRKEAHEYPVFLITGRKAG
jgi:tRNA (cmo5U34)-methyltransferase